MMCPDSNHRFTEIYSAFYKKSFVFVRSYVHDEMAAEDIVAEGLIKLWERMKQKPLESVAPFLFTILKNDSLDYLKHRRVKQSAAHTINQKLTRELELRIFSLEATDPKEIFSDEIREIIRRTLDSLPPKTREIFMMSRYENKPHKELAELFNISIKGVDYHIARSVKDLRLALKDYLPLAGALTFLG